MSNLWALYGRVCFDPDFVELITDTKTTIESEGLSLRAALARIDEKILQPSHCPLGHLDARLYYDTIILSNFVQALGPVLKSGAFKGHNLDVHSLAFREYCAIIGLACTDPWIGSSALNPGGFRINLADETKDPVATIVATGFVVTDELAKKIQQDLQIITDTQKKVLEVMNDVSADWDPVTVENVTDRKGYNFDDLDACLPPGWIKVTGLGTGGGARPSKRREGAHAG